ncbi:MAG TPA: hypothetical protein VLE53_15800 [Gemmatimonadaceae bacterium]|nr:hypothetical protein [Gemmatimonadaceae bacterium]
MQLDVSRLVRRVLAAALLALAAEPAGAQVLEVRPVTPAAVGPTLRELRAQQEEFESFRRQRLPHWGGSMSPDRCDETIGRFCYWYEEGDPDPPPEPRAIRDARERLIARLDSAGSAHPHDRWISGQRVRYLVEAERNDDAVAAARECAALDSWCHALQGFAYHAAGRYAEADGAYESALALMSPRERCEWRDLKLLIDEVLMRRYRDMTCEARLAFEERIWWLSRPRMTAPGNDARTEYYSRVMMVRFLEDAPSTYRLDFGPDERELLLRYGWPTAWTRAGGTSSLSAGFSLVGHEPRPAYPFIPPASVLDNPATSDSAIWRSKGVGRVLARYAPAYARRLLPLEHQAGLFRRGDSALVVAAWSVAADTALAAAAAVPGELTAALALTKGAPSDTAIARAASIGTHGTLMAAAPWGSMLLSLEIAAPSRRTLARARYGVRGSDVPGSRVQMSDMLLYEPYEGLPRTLEDVLPHVRSSERVTEGSSVGLYWETYNTNPTGEAIDVSITVVAEDRGGGWLTRALRSLRGVRAQQPITMGMQDVSARVPYAPRSVVVDLATLRPGRYRIEVEQDAGGGNVVRAQRSITVVERR